MSYSFETIIKEEIQRFLNENDLKEEVTSKQIVDAILAGSAYYEIRVRNKKLILFKLFSPVTQREEVFIGSVLLNSFLSKNILLCCRKKDLGPVTLVANDIENFYYLWWTDKELEDLREAFLITLENNLEDLYFSDRNEEKGIYGEFSKLFEFHKNNIEAFPIFPIPKSFLGRLGKLARENLLKKIEEFDFLTNPTKITANMSFFLSKAGNEFQSPYVLLEKMVSEYKETGLELDELKTALNIDKKYNTTNQGDLVKDIKESLGKVKFSSERLRNFFKKIVHSYAELAEKDPDEWNMKYSQAKALNASPREVVMEIINQVQMGYLLVNRPKSESTNTYCRCCGANSARLMENHIIMGEDVGKFHNQIVNKDVKNEIKICLKCCIQSFLMTKLVGNIAGSLAFVPQQGSMIFHYGRHSDEEVKAIAATLKKSLELINERRDLRYSLAKLKKDQREILSKLENASAKTKSDLEVQKNNIEKQLKETSEKAKRSENMLAKLMKGDLNIDNDPAVTLLTEANIEIDSAENYVFGVGLGNYRLMVFILPQIKYRVEKKAHNYIQERFSASRTNILIMLSFLRKLCGCDGPYYFMCLPSVVEGNFSTDAFYVRDKNYSAAEVMEYYEAFATFSNQVIKWEEDKNRRMVKRILLSEKVIEEPLTTISEVMRHSKIFSSEGDDKYKVIYDSISQKPNVEEYYKIFLKGREYALHKTQEVEK